MALGDTKITTTPGRWRITGPHRFHVAVRVAAIVVFILIAAPLIATSIVLPASTTTVSVDGVSHTDYDWSDLPQAIVNLVIGMLIAASCAYAALRRRTWSHRGLRDTGPLQGAVDQLVASYAALLEALLTKPDYETFMAVSAAEDAVATAMLDVEFLRTLTPGRARDSLTYREGGAAVASAARRKIDALRAGLAVSA